MNGRREAAWAEHGHPSILGWADDLEVFATDVDSMEAMAASIQALAHNFIGFALRPEKCKWAKVRRHDGPDIAARGPTPLRAREGLRVLGAQAQVDGKHRE